MLIEKELLVYGCQASREHFHGNYGMTAREREKEEEGTEQFSRSLSLSFLFFSLRSPEERERERERHSEALIHCLTKQKILRLQDEFRIVNALDYLTLGPFSSRKDGLVTQHGPAFVSI